MNQSQGKIRLSVVSYLNSKPFIYALKNSSIMNEIDLSLDIPSDCANKLSDGRADIGLIPVAVIPELKQGRIISEYCISSNANVGSVLLLSHTRLEKIKTIYLDYQSRTSAALVKILAYKLWKIKPEWIDGKPGYEKLISGECAGLVIGDRALQERHSYPFVYDLAAEWRKMSGLPFVFACWVSNSDIPEDFIERLNLALSNSERMIEAVVDETNDAGLSKTEISEYLHKNIQFVLDDSKRKAMNLFLQYLKEMS